jgi:hypothetical protein
MRTFVLDGKAEPSGAHEINLLPRKVLQVLVVHVNDISTLKLLVRRYIDCAPVI